MQTLESEEEVFRSGTALAEESSSMDYEFLKRLSNLFWSERRFLLRSAAAGLLAGLLIAFLIPPQYDSTVRLMPPDSSSSSPLSLLSAITGGSGSSGALTGGFGMVSDVLGMKTSGALFVGILQSRTLQDDLISRFDLRGVYWVSRWEQARKILTRRTSISEERKSGIITLVVSDRDRMRSERLAQAYIDELNKLVAQLSTSSARRERVFLQGRLKEVKQDLDSAAVQFSQFASKNTTIDMPAQSKAMVESAATLQGELIAAQSELSGLQQIYSANNVRVKSLKARVGELQRQLDIVGGKDIGKEGPSASDDEKLYPSIRELPLLGVGYSDLYRKLKIQEAIYEYLTKQYELAKVQEAKEIPTVRVLDPPDVPERRAFPPRTLITLWVMILFLIGGASWVWVEQAWARLNADHPLRLAIHDFRSDIREIRHAKLLRFSR